MVYFRSLFFNNVFIGTVLIQSDSLFEHFVVSFDAILSSQERGNVDHDVVLIGMDFTLYPFV